MNFIALYTAVFASLVSRAADTAEGVVDATQSAYEVTSAVVDGDIPVNNGLLPNLGRVFEWFADQAIEAFLGIVGLLFTYGTRYFLFFENPMNKPGLNEYWMDTLPIYVAIILFGFISYYPVMMLLSDDDQTDIDRITERIILSAILVFISREMIAFFINVSHGIAFNIIPQDFTFYIAYDIFEIINTAVAGTITIIGAALFSSFLTGSILVSVVVFYLVLAMRMLIIYIVYAMFPVFAGLWAIDVGPAKYGKTLADFTFKIAGVMIVMGIVISAVLAVGVGVANAPDHTDEFDFASDYPDDPSGTAVLSTDPLGPQTSQLEANAGQFDSRSVAELMFTLFMYVGSMWVIVALSLSVGGMMLSAGASSPGGMGGVTGSRNRSGGSKTSHHPAVGSNPEEGIWGGRYGEETSGTAYSQQLDDGRLVMANPAGGGVIVNPDAPMNSEQFNGIDDQRFETFTPEENPLADDDVAPNPFQDPEPVQWGERASNISDTLRSKAGSVLGEARDKSGRAGSEAADVARSTADAAEETLDAGAEKVNESEYIERDVTEDVESLKQAGADVKQTAAGIRETASDFVSDPIGTADRKLDRDVAGAAVDFSQAKKQYAEFGNQKLGEYIDSMGRMSDKFQETRVGGYTIKAAGRTGSLMRRGGSSLYAIHKKPSIESSAREAKRIWLESDAHAALGDSVPGIRHEDIDKQHDLQEGYGAFEMGRNSAAVNNHSEWPDSRMQAQGSADVDNGSRPPTDTPRTEEQVIDQNISQASAESVAASYEINPSPSRPPYTVPDEYQGRGPDVTRLDDGYGPDPAVDDINGAHHTIRSQSAKNVAEEIGATGYDDISVNHVVGQINHEMQHLESVVDDYDGSLDMSREELGVMIEQQAEMGVPPDIAVKRTAEVAINEAADPINQFTTDNEVLAEFGVEEVPDSLATGTPIRRINLDKEGVNADNASDIWRVERNDGSVVYEQGDVNHAGVNAVQTQALMTQLGVNAPQHHFDPVNGVLRTEGLQGDTLSEVMNGQSDISVDDIDADELVDAYAAMGLSGHNDVSGDNLVVQDDGSITPIDYDTAGGNVADKEPLAIDEAQRVADELGVDVSEHDVKGRMTELANEYVDSDKSLTDQVDSKLPDADADPDKMLVDHYSDENSPHQIDRELKEKRRRGMEQAREMDEQIHRIADGDADWQYNSPRSTGDRSHNLDATGSEVTTGAASTDDTVDIQDRATEPYSYDPTMSDSTTDSSQTPFDSTTDSLDTSSQYSSSTYNTTSEESNTTPSDANAGTETDTATSQRDTSRRPPTTEPDSVIDDSSYDPTTASTDSPVESSVSSPSEKDTSGGVSEDTSSQSSAVSDDTSDFTPLSTDSGLQPEQAPSGTRSERVSDTSSSTSSITPSSSSDSSVTDDRSDYDLQSSTPSPTRGSQQPSEEASDGIESMATDKGIHAQIEDSIDKYTSDLDRNEL